MKREQMVEIIMEELSGKLNYSEMPLITASELLAKLEASGMKPPCLDSDTCQAIMSVYYAGYTLNQWDEDIEKDEEVMAKKKRRAEARARLKSKGEN